MGTASFRICRDPAAAVFLLADNRLLREALLRILSKRDDIRVVGAGSYAPEVHAPEQIYFHCAPA